MSNTITPYQRKDASKKEEVKDMFDNIAHNYDFVNRVMTGGKDVKWRRKAVAKLASIQPKIIVDIATGTGDFAIEALALNPDKVIGIDLSPGMLEIGKKKMQERGLSEIISMELGDSEGLRFEDNSIDAVTVGYGVRNFEDLEKGLSEILRVLRPGGKLAILETSTPQKFPTRQLFLFYVKYIMPVFGRILSKDKKAYKYLQKSAIAFPSGKVFTDIMLKVGFVNCEAEPVMMGASSIYTGEK